MLHAPAEPLRHFIARLPARPPAMALATALNLALRPKLNDAHRTMLHRRVVLIGVTDAGIECRISWSGSRFVAHARNTPHDVAIRASMRDFYALAFHTEDPDTLFFQRRLRIEGDTALGLGIKNLLDSVELPGWIAGLHARWMQRQSRFI